MIANFNKEYVHSKELEEELDSLSKEFISKLLEIKQRHKVPSIYITSDPYYGISYNISYKDYDTCTDYAKSHPQS